MFCNVIAVNIEQVIMFTLEAFEFSALLDFYLQSFLNVIFCLTMECNRSFGR